jgi:hypothetical protein
VASAARRYLPFLGLVVGVVAPRLPTINFDVLNVDEAVYLLVGRAWRMGALPYVDIVDRKPLGLFFINAVADAMFWDPIVGARIIGVVATLLAAWLIMTFAQRFMRLGPMTSMACGLLYSTYGLLFGGDAVEAPIYSAPFLVGAAILILSDMAKMREGGRPSPMRLVSAGLLLSATFQIKYVTAAESLAFGLIYLITGWTCARRKPGLWREVVFSAGMMTLAAVLPMALLYGVYAAMGHGREFFFYIFSSNFDRGPTDATPAVFLRRISLFSLAFAPLLFLSGQFLLRYWRGHAGTREVPSWVVVFLLSWFGAAMFAGIFQMQFYDHHFYEAVLPLALIAGAALRPANPGKHAREASIKTAVIVLGLATSGYMMLRLADISQNGSPYQPSRIAADIASTRARSMYVFNYHSLLYALADIELPTKYPLASHMLRDLEAQSFHFDALAEINRILDQDPQMIVVQRPIDPTVSADRRELIEAKLGSQYCLWRSYKAGAASDVELYVMRNAGLNIVEAACEDPTTPNDVIEASDHEFRAEARAFVRQRNAAAETLVTARRAPTKPQLRRTPAAPVEVKLPLAFVDDRREIPKVPVRQSPVTAARAPVATASIR